MTENVLTETGTMALFILIFFLCVAMLAVGAIVLIRFIEKDDKPKIKTRKYGNI